MVGGTGRVETSAAVVVAVVIMLLEVVAVLAGELVKSCIRK